MRTALLLLPYGTVIPELRAIVYQRSTTSLVHTVSPETLLHLDDYLTGSSAGAWEPDLPDPEKNLLREIYRDRPVDRELLELCRSIRSAGTPVYLRGFPPLLYTLYRTVLPENPGILESSDDVPGTDSTHTIVVTRDLNVLEETFEQGGQGIHYQSAFRLQRELELRGLFVPDISSGHIEMSGG